MELTGPQKKQLRKGIVKSWATPSQFEMFLSDEFDENFDHLSAPVERYPIRVFQVIKHAESETWLGDLILKVYTERPKREEFILLSQELGLAGVHVSFPQVLAPVSGLGGTSENLASKTTSPQGLDRITGSNSFMDISLATRIALVQQRVCLVEVEGRGKGTGFLVAPDLVLTADHVVNERKMEPAAIRCRFDFKAGQDGTTLQDGQALPLADDGVVLCVKCGSVTGNGDTDAGLHFGVALLRISECIGATPVGLQGDEPRGWMRLSDASPVSLIAADKPIFVYQHADAGPIQISQGRLLPREKQPDPFAYEAHTRPGSSGGPICELNMNVIGLHAGVRRTPPHNHGFGVTADEIESVLSAADITLPVPPVE